jgi:hypothetical protein
MKAKLYKEYIEELDIFFCEIFVKDFPLSVANAIKLCPFFEAENENTVCFYGDVEDIATELAYVAVFHPNEVSRNIFIAMEEAMLADKDVGDEFNATFNQAYKGFSK